MNSAASQDYRAEFLFALHDPAARACPRSFDPRYSRRFRVYRNNVYSSLISALGDAYPVVQRLVGDEFFKAMAIEFIRSESVRAPSLALYGAGFARFIEQFEPAQSVVYLADMARLEHARLQTMHSADARSLDAADLTHDGIALLSAILQPHPALRIVESAHPVYTIWLANQQGQAESLITAGSEQLLLTRPRYTVQMQLLEAPALSFTSLLINGFCIQDAYSRAASRFGDFDLAAVFSSLLQAGAFSQIILPGEIQSCC
jgi:hypothetical protein